MIGFVDYFLPNKEPSNPRTIFCPVEPPKLRAALFAKVPTVS